MENPGAAKPSPKEHGQPVVEVKQNVNKKAKAGKVKSKKKMIAEPGTIPLQHADLYDLPQSTDHDSLVEAMGEKEEKPMSRAEKKEEDQRGIDVRE